MTTMEYRIKRTTRRTGDSCRFAVAAGPGLQTGRYLALGLLLILATACDGGGGGGSIRGLPVLQNIEKGQNLAVLTLNEGTHPVAGNSGPRQLRVFRGEADLAAAWYDYTADDLPDVDFSQNTVVLYDRGTTNLNHCGAVASLDRVTATEFQDGIALVTFHLRQVCNANIACAAYVDPGRPYTFVSVSGYHYRALPSESLTRKGCKAGAGWPQPLDVVTIADSLHPESGEFGPRRMEIITDEEELVRVWSDYRDDIAPVIDFGSSAVVLYDEGSSVLNACEFPYQIDVSATALGDELQKVAFDFSHECQDENKGCLQGGLLARPYRFLKIPRRYNPWSGDMLLSHALQLTKCWRS